VNAHFKTVKYTLHGLLRLSYSSEGTKHYG